MSLMFTLGAAPAFFAPAWSQVEAANGVGTPFELAFWDAVANSNDVAQYQAYLQRYPNGTFAGLARAKLAKLGFTDQPVRAYETGPAPVTSAPVPVPAPAPLPAAPAPALPAPAASFPPPAAALPAPAAALPAPTPAPTPAPVAAPEASPMDLLMGGQGNRPYSDPATVMAALGPEPRLEAPPPFDIPSSFCSLADRNAFYDSSFKPARDAADRNNTKTIAYLQSIQALFQRYSALNDLGATTTLAKVSTAYQPVAAAAYAASSRFSGLFDQLMKVPVKKC